VVRERDEPQSPNYQITQLANSGLPSVDAKEGQVSETAARTHARKAWRGGEVAFGDFGLKALEPCWLTDRQIEAARVAMTRSIKRGGKIWVRVFPDKPITKKPQEPAWQGQGSPEQWVAVVRPGRVLFEMEGVTETEARAALSSPRERRFSPSSPRGSRREDAMKPRSSAISAGTSSPPRNTI